jgi:hypothetical protein
MARTYALGGGSGEAEDQARLPTFRAALVIQVLASAAFGILPVLAPDAYASITGYSGHDPLVYRLGGAATTGYLVGAVAALLSNARWAELRIPSVATITFTAAAVLASGWSVLEGDRHLVAEFVLIAAAAFTVIAALFIRRDRGEPVDPGAVIAAPFRWVIALATLSAATFGLFPLLAPGLFAQVFGLAGTDGWIFRLAGAACLGYATAGVLTFRAAGYRLVAIQNRAAIAFNLLGAISAWIAVASGSGGILAPVVALAATFFTVALTLLDRTAST